MKKILTLLAAVVSLVLVTDLSLAQEKVAAPLTGYALHVDAIPEKDPRLLHHHYFKKVNDDLIVGILFDSDTADAKLIGTEMVISKRLWESLPDSLKPIWHPHGPEVEAGALTVVGVAPEEAKKTLEFIAGTYGQMVFTTLPLRAVPE